MNFRTFKDLVFLIYVAVQEFMMFASKTIAERTLPGQRQSVKQENYMIHCYCERNEVAVCISNQQYPSRVAFDLLVKVLAANEVEEVFKKYQKPEQVDQLLTVQKELDETKVVLHDTINSVLERGQKLDDLVNKSEALSSTSKTFYKQAQKTNSCCHLM